MKRLLISLIAILSLTLHSYSNHISGGEMYYTLISQTGNDYKYLVTLKLFRDGLGGGPQLAMFESIAIYPKGSSTSIWTKTNVPRTSYNTIQLTAPGPCISNPPVVIYDVAIYQDTVVLPGISSGYVISFQRCCRVNGIANVTNSAAQGVTYSAEIPGNLPDPNAPANNSAHFLGIDTVVICAGYPFTYNFGAQDTDGDQLVYSFCDGYASGPGNQNPSPPNPPPYTPLSYRFPYNGGSPLGSSVSLNTSTGFISGTAPPAGTYVITVCVQEFRNGVLIATQRKDLQVKVADCDIAKVTLEPDGYTNCADYTVSFNNLTPSSLINNYFWDFGDLTTLADTSRITKGIYTYPDTGVYTVKVVANRNQPCSDSVTAKVRVFPGFFPDFSSTGVCINSPIQFNDLTTATYGSINFWRYDFGVAASSIDTSRLQHPQFTYTSTGNYTAEFIVGSDKGCRDTISKPVRILDKPPITMAFHDTLICSIDTLQLNATGNGIISWSPNYNILNSASGTPSVFPKNTTWYSVELNENGCLNKDSVRIRVVDVVSLIGTNDTVICANDAVQLSAVTDGLQYSWSPDPSLNNLNILNPVATPAATTAYHFTARIGNCSTSDDIVITVVTRPSVNAGNDIDICYKSSAQLNAQTNGTSFTWSSSSSLSEPASLNPIASPKVTTSYILTATDLSSGCPKPSYDTVTVTVLPRVNAFAGNDTIVIASLPLQLKASGGVIYNWAPANGLDNPNIASPVATFDGNQRTVTYTVTVIDQAGCHDTSSISVTVYKTGPEIFVPTGFTPNGDGRNDVFRPTYVGMKSIDYFRVYNRWGDLIYSHNLNDGRGWDGTIRGVKQSAGTFVWMTKATDVLGKVHVKKGTVVLLQ